MIRRRRNPMSADAENKAIIRQLYEEVWNKRRLELVDEILSPSHALHDPNATGSAVGPQAYKSPVTRFITVLPDLRFIIEDSFGENEKLANSVAIFGNDNGALMSIAAMDNELVV